jgi:hypothetical protein
MITKNMLSILVVIIVIFTHCTNYTPIYIATGINNPPVIDGQIDEIWNKAKNEAIDKSIVGVANRKDDRDFKVIFRSLWDYSNLYFLFVITDDVKLYYPEINWYNNDLVQIFIGKLKNMNTPYLHASNLLQYTFIYSVDSLLLNGQYLPKTMIEFKRTNTSDGYILEIKIPWNDIGIKPNKKMEIPTNIEAADLDKKESEYGIIGIKETVLGWAPNTADRSWANPKTLGNLILF